MDKLINIIAKQFLGSSLTFELSKDNPYEAVSVELIKAVGYHYPKETFEWNSHLVEYYVLNEDNKEYDKKRVIDLSFRGADRVHDGCRPAAPI